jgi:hypothetical protein
MRQAPPTPTLCDTQPKQAQSGQGDNQQDCRTDDGANCHEFPPIWRCLHTARAGFKSENYFISGI